MSSDYLKEIDHIGIAVKDLETAISWYEKVFGTQVAHRETVSSQEVEEALLPVAESFIQLLTPTSPTSPVSKFLEKHGEGIHHVAYRVENCAEVLNQLRQLGLQLVNSEPILGSRGTKVAFVHPKSSFGTLIELVET